MLPKEPASDFSGEVEVKAPVRGVPLQKLVHVMKQLNRQVPIAHCRLPFVGLCQYISGLAA